MKHTQEGEPLIAPEVPATAGETAAAAAAQSVERSGAPPSAAEASAAAAAENVSRSNAPEGVVPPVTKSLKKSDLDSEEDAPVPEAVRDTG